jgi:hypothetical protein
MYFISLKITDYLKITKGFPPKIKKKKFSFKKKIKFNKIELLESYFLMVQINEKFEFL